VLNPGVKHGKLTANVSGYMVKKSMPVHSMVALGGVGGGDSRHIRPLILISK